MLSPRCEPMRHSRSIQTAQAIGCLIFCLTAALTTVVGCHGNDQGQRSACARLRSAIPLSGDSAPAAASALDELLAGMGSGELTKVAGSSDTLLAIHACWELTQRSPSPPFEPETSTYLPRALERTTGITVPLDWETQFAIIQSVDDHSRLEVLKYYETAGCNRICKVPNTCPGYRFDATAQRRVQSRAGVQVVPGTDVAFDGGSLAFQQGDIILRCSPQVLPTRDLRQLGKYDCTVALGNTQSYIAFSTREPKSYRLYCVDSKSGKIRWSNEIWSSYPRGAPCLRSGPGYTHDVYIVVGHDNVVVLGAGFECYAEVFDAQSGKAIARFATNRWGYGSSGPNKPCSSGSPLPDN